MSIKKQKQEEIHQTIKQVQDIERIKNNQTASQIKLFIESFADFLDLYPDIEKNFDRLSFDINRKYEEDDGMSVPQIAFENFEVNFFSYNANKTWDINKTNNVKKDITRFLNIWQENSKVIEQFMSQDLLEIDFNQCQKSYRQSMLETAQKLFPSSNKRKTYKLGKI